MGLFFRYNKIWGHKNPTYLDNREEGHYLQEDHMAQNKKRIRREIMLHGERVWITADTEQEYANRLLRLSGMVPSGSRHSFHDYAYYWFQTFAEPNVARVTAIAYKRQLDNRIDPVLGPMNIEDIRPAHIQGVFNDMPPESKQDTKNKVKNVLNQIFKMAVEDELILRNPMLSSSLKIKGPDATTTEPYSVEDMRYFASHLMDIVNPMDRAWMALSISLPLRSEEVLGLRWMDVDNDPCLIHVRSTITHPTRNEAVFTPYTKTAPSRRELVPPKQIFSYLPDRGRDEDFVIGGAVPVTYTRLRKMRERIARQIGYDGSITPRRFRTTVATDISDCTHDLKLVQKTLGHATPQMTLKHYDKGRSTSADASNAIAACYGLF